MAMKRSCISLAIATIALAWPAGALSQSPMEWPIHDLERPQPTIVTSGTFSTPDTPGKAPSDAIVLFDGTDLSAWKTSKDGGAAAWKVENGYMEVVKGSGSIETKRAFGDIQLHMEFSTPTPPEGESQGRGNSGVFLMGRYEVQVLDSYDNATYSDGQAAAMYGQRPPDVNASRGPGQWQAYDIVFRAPRFEGDELASPGVVTVFHNGVVVHHAEEFLGATAHRRVGKYAPHEPEGPISLQDHGNPIRFRNVWVRRL